MKCRRATGHFSHAVLQTPVPQQFCATCHGQERWKPASFDHARSFVLDRDHTVKCATCHTGESYKQYTCYGCHEHSRGKIAEEHLEEGIRDFENCVRCHRSADEHDIRWDARDSGGFRRSRHDDDD